MNSRDRFSTDTLFQSTLRTFRLLISDAVWAEVEPVLRALTHAAGSPRASSEGAGE